MKSKDGSLKKIKKINKCLPRLTHKKKGKERYQK